LFFLSTKNLICRTTAQIRPVFGTLQLFLLSKSSHFKIFELETLEAKCNKTIFQEGHNNTGISSLTAKYHPWIAACVVVTSTHAEAG
jgi:hypothetical protein